MLCKFYISHLYTKHPALRLPPGPPELPLIGSLHHFLLSRFRDLPHRTMHELSTAYGPLMLLRLGTVPTVVVSSGEMAMEITKIHDLSFCSKPLSPTTDIISCGGRDIAFSPYNEHWRELRKICMLNLLNQRRVLDFRHVREDEVARLIHAVTNEWSNGQLINLSEKIFCMVNDIVLRTTIGRRSKHRDEFLHELEGVMRLICGFNLVDLYPSSKLIHWLSTSARDIGKCQSRIYHIIESIIHERDTTLAVAQDDLLSVLLKLQKDGELQFTLTNEIISAVIFDIFTGGSDTAATTLEWAVSELVKNPRALHKAQSEVRETFNGQRRLVIKETLRLHPPAPLVPRECREKCQIMGYDVPKGMAVVINIWAIGRDSKYWDAAEEFRPERFYNSSIDFKGTDFEYIPFGAGRRICPGMTYGNSIMELALASLLYYFDWELPAGVKTEDFNMTEDFGLTVKRKSKLLLHAKPHYNFEHNAN
ncbi:hypothetical protein PR202_gb12606 [Eleusine coracana subsp. coracana]|uniref:Cytochrome P450 n=1 Tax=Eleusine coracana subsp. coracana TaxID=191504 RepID=A0AAV5ENB0_ELECO|nr:hypothetical protein PR202_gb12606 [Eleusine coracana subsp. coracana]